MEINLTLTQWEELKILVRQGRKAEKVLEKPVAVGNSSISIEVKENAVDIILSDA